MNSVQADLSNEAGLKSATPSIRATHQFVDSLVLCAGVRKMQKKTYTLGQPLSLLAEAMQSMDITDADMDSWEIEQADFFLNLGVEPEGDLLQAEYVDLLQQLHTAREE